MAKAKTQKKTKDEITVERRSTDRRESPDRRTTDESVAIERRQEPRRKVARRRQIDPTTCERDYTEPEIEFMHAMDEYKRRSGRMFPTCSEILEVIGELGYRKISPEQLASEQPAETNVDVSNTEGSAVEEFQSESDILEGCEDHDEF